MFRPWEYTYVYVFTLLTCLIPCATLLLFIREYRPMSLPTTNEIVRGIELCILVSKPEARALLYDRVKTSYRSTTVANSGH